MKNTIKRKPESGFTLLELLISITMLSFVFVAAASYITTTMRLTQLNQHTVMAIHYAEDLQEWINAEQATNWDTLVDKASADGLVYCFNNRLTYDSSWPTQTGSCTNYQGMSDIPPQIFKREVTLKKFGTPPTRVQSTVRVSWKELGKTHENITERVYSLYQQ